MPCGVTTIYRFVFAPLNPVLFWAGLFILFVLLPAQGKEPDMEVDPSACLRSQWVKWEACFLLLRQPCLLPCLLTLRTVLVVNTVGFSALRPCCTSYTSVNLQKTTFCSGGGPFLQHIHEEESFKKPKWRVWKNFGSCRQVQSTVWARVSESFCHQRNVFWCLEMEKSCRAKW